MGCNVCLLADGCIAPGPLPCRCQVLEAHYAIAGGCKAVVLNLNQRLAPVELQYIFANARPVWLIVARQYTKLAEDAVRLSRQEDGGGTVRGIIWVNDAGGGGSGGAGAASAAAAAAAA
eukprot:SAG22_NODE_1641_length_3909_cov_1.422047_3_plen_118_part_01